AKNFPDTSGSPKDESVRWLTRRNRDLPTNDKNGAPSRKRFSKAGENLKKGNRRSRRPRSKDDAHYSTPHFNSVIDRSFAGVAIQHRLGLLSKRRAGIDPGDRGNPRRDGKSLTQIESI